MAIDTLASNVGYKNPRSDAFADAMKLLVKDGFITKSKNSCMFTDQGIAIHAPEESEVAAADPQAAIDQLWQQLEGKLKSGKNTKSDSAVANAKEIWKLLMDGSTHSLEEVLEVTTYKMDRSTGFPDVLNAMKEIGFATKEDKQVQLTEKVLNFAQKAK